MEKFAVWDIESNDWVKLEIIGFFDGREYRTFNDVESFIKYLDQPRFNGWKLYAHNGGRFDDNFLIAPLLDKRKHYRCSFLPRANTGTLICLTVQMRRARIQFLDSYALLPQSLDSLCKAFNVEHKKQKFNVKKGVNRRDKKLLEYLKNDCLGLYEILAAFWASDFVVHHKLTIASQALDTWRTKFLGDHKLVEMDIEHETLFREKYYSGGRVEVYRSMGKNISVFDVNSLFPFAMLSEMPVGECFETSTYHRGDIGFYQVQIKGTPDWRISPLLVKRRRGSATENYYVNGPGIYFLSSATLEYLRSMFGIRFNVIGGLYFKRREYLFNDYVEFFYKMKADNKGNALYMISKLLLNSLYGKLATKRERWRIEQMSSKLLRMKRYAMFSEELGLVLTMEQSKSRFILPYLAGYITDLARLHHYQLMNLSPDSVFYCDTDSIFTDDPRAFKPFVGDGIGKLSYEGTFDGIFLAPKTYALRNGEKEKICFKGFNADKFRFRDFQRALVGGKVLTERRERVLSMIECVNMANAKKESSRVIVHDQGPFLKVVETEKTVKSNYDKREMYPSARYFQDSRPWNYRDIIDAVDAIF